VAEAFVAVSSLRRLSSATARCALAFDSPVSAAIVA
jgi:hypothetical protein